MLSRTKPCSIKGGTHRGLSVVELLVGVAVGLFLVAGASTLFVTNLANSRQLLLEARIVQDLRATADMITRDLRRAGYWGNALAGTVATAASGVSTTGTNPYRSITPGTGMIEYTFSRDTTENDTLDSNENFGFRRAVVSGVGVMQMKLGTGNWQTITDPDSMDVTAFTVTPTETDIDMRDACAVACAGASCPTIRVRQYALTLTARAIGDPRVVRTLQTRVRPRNDEFRGACP